MQILKLPVDSFLVCVRILVSVFDYGFEFMIILLLVAIFLVKLQIFFYHNVLVSVCVCVFLCKYLDAHLFDFNILIFLN